jgi:hypothetical protein
MLLLSNKNIVRTQINKTDDEKDIIPHSGSLAIASITGTKY